MIPLISKKYSFVTILFLAIILLSCSQKPNSLTKYDYLEYFESIKGKGCVSGQFIRWNYNASLEEITAAYDSSGQWVGMLGADYYANFQDSVPAPKCQYKLANDVIDSYYEKNGLVNLSVHFINPQTGGSAWDNHIDFDSLLISDSRIQKNFLTEIDSVVIGLEKLQETGVMIMFRPFHEMNGGWFWWGKQDRYIELWKFTYHYIVNKKGLTNLLWCWSPDAGAGNICKYFPGDEFVDIVGLDAYACNLVESTQTINAYREILKYNKPFGFTECGCDQEYGLPPNTPIAEIYDYNNFLGWLKNDFPEAVFFLVWRDKWGFAGKLGVRDLLNDPFIINKEELTELDKR